MEEKKNEIKVQDTEVKTTSTQQNKVVIENKDTKQEVKTSIENKKQTKVKKEKGPRKPLSNFIAYPLVLGTVCLVCGGVIAGVNYATAPIVEHNNYLAMIKTCYDMLGDENIDKTQGDQGLTAVEVTGYKTLKGVFQVHMKNPIESAGKTYKDVYYYNIQTTGGYKAPYTVGAVVVGDYGKENGGILYSLKVIDCSQEDALGASQLKELTIKPGYDGTGDFMKDYVTSGATAKVTFGKLDEALKEAINQFNGKVPYTEGYVETKDGYEIYYADTQFDEVFSHFTGLVSIKDNKVYKVEILSQENTIEGSWTEGGEHDYGFGPIDFTKFSQTYVPTEDKPIDFSVYENANSSSEGIVSGATQASYGYVEFVKEAISFYNEKHK